MALDPCTSLTQIMLLDGDDGFVWLGANAEQEITVLGYDVEEGGDNYGGVHVG